MISFSPRSDMSLVSTITTRLPLRFIRRCVLDTGVFTDHGEVTLRDLLAGPAWVWMTSAGDSLIKFSGYLIEFFCAVFHCDIGISEWWCRRDETGVLDQHPSRRRERI